MADELDFRIQASLDEQKSINKIQQQLENISKKINISFTVDNASLNRINKEVELIQKAISKNKIKIVDFEEAKAAGIEFEKSLDAVRKKYEQIGQVNFTNKIFDPITKELTSFTAKVEQADGIIKEFKYNLVSLKEGNQISQAFQLDKIKEIDNTARIREQQLQKEHEINRQLQKDAEEYVRWWEKALNERDAFNRQRISQLGIKKGDVLSDVFNQSSQREVMNALTEYVRETYKAEGATHNLEKTQIGLTKTTDKLGNEIYRYNIAIKDGSGVAKVFQGNIDRLTASLYENSIKTRDATNRSLGLVSQMKIALQRVPVWLVGTTAVFGTLHTLKDIISTIVEVDSKMTELKRVMDSNVDFNKFLQDNIDLSKELGRQLNDVLDIVNEIARQGYDPKQTLELTKVAGMLQNISDLTPEESLDALTAAMKNFNITAQDSIHIADALNEVNVLLAS